MTRIHLAELLDDEMVERQWSRDTFTWKMEPNATAERWGVNRLALDLFMEVRCPRVILGEMADQFARALDVDRAFFQNFHEEWRKHAPPCDEACCKAVAV